MKTLIKNKRELLGVFKKDIKEIFKNNLIFAFLCGSVAKNEFSKKSDVDIFVCLRKQDIMVLKKFNIWYRQINKNYNFLYDKQYPGEIVSLNNLNLKLKSISLVTPQFNVKKNNIYDGIVWSGMLSGKYIAFVGDKIEFLKKRKVAKKIVKLWKEKLLKNLKTLPADIALKYLIKFTNKN